MENCEGSWDAETIRALMGSACLYVLRERDELESVPPASTTADRIGDSEHEANDADFITDDHPWLSHAVHSYITW